jgi:hypothetical protein
VSQVRELGKVQGLSVSAYVFLRVHFTLLTLGLAYSCVDDLQNGDGEGGSLSGSGLSLSDGVATFADLDNGSRLYSRGRLVAVCIDASQQVLLQMHSLESRRNRDFLGRVELHLILRLAIDSVGHDCGCVVVGIRFRVRK